jgi:hypothetical protein
MSCTSLQTRVLIKIHTQCGQFVHTRTSVFRQAQDMGSMPWAPCRVCVKHGSTKAWALLTRKEPQPLCYEVQACPANATGWAGSAALSGLALANADLHSSQGLTLAGLYWSTGGSTFVAPPLSATLLSKREPVMCTLYKGQ